jgi:hypothetical protein
MRNLWITKEGAQSPYEQFHGQPSPLKPKDLIHWGRLGFVTDRTKIKAKTKPRGFPAIMVGYADHHSSDCYRMFNPATNAIIITRDVVWSEWIAMDPESHLLELREAQPHADTTPGIELTPTPELPIEADSTELVNTVAGGNDAGRNGRNAANFQAAGPMTRARTQGTARNIDYARQPLGREPGDVFHEHQLDELTDEERRYVDVYTYDNDEETTVQQDNSAATAPASRTRSHGVVTTPETPSQSKEVQNLRTYYNPIPQEDEEEEANLVLTAMMSDPGEPASIREALSGSDSKAWEESIRSEINNFLNRKAWTQVSMDRVHQEKRKTVGTKTVFKIKNEHDGSIRRKTRIVTQGFSMIPGKDYTESYSPVATDVSVRTCIAL